MRRLTRLFASRVSRQPQAFYRSERGAVLTWLAILVPILLGLGTLAVDMSRLFSLQTQLQNAADALALSGAAELNGSSTSITRSTNAINNLVVNNQRFGASGIGQVSVLSIRFMQTLPVSDATAISNANLTTDPTVARYVEVQVSPVSMNFILPFFSGIANATTGARATAGLCESLCQSTPMFVCNPWEGSGMTLQQAANDPAQLRRLIDLKAGGGGNNQYSAGNYGYLQPIASGASALEHAIAQVTPASCSAMQDGVSVRPGQVNSADRGFNVRFDKYAGNLSGDVGDDRRRHLHHQLFGPYVCAGQPAALALFGLSLGDRHQSHSGGGRADALHRRGAFGQPRSPDPVRRHIELPVTDPTRSLNGRQFRPGCASDRLRAVLPHGANKRRCLRRVQRDC
ncbi:MAG: pilus assembly protein [Proteobacteria bacterium]|nr:pilus assembly protein [Pseudomonadota bacterium]